MNADHEHDWKYDHDDYGSLAQGGSYEVYKCECGAVHYCPLAD